jgi:hypothetical protein
MRRYACPRILTTSLGPLLLAYQQPKSWRPRLPTMLLTTSCESLSILMASSRTIPRKSSSRMPDSLNSWKANGRNATVPMPEGPLHKFFTEIAKLQALERSRRRTDGTYRQKIRVAIVTARNAPAHERVVTTLRTLGITVDETFFLGGIEKAKVLKVLRRRLAHYSRMTATSPERVTRAMNGPGLWAHIL